MPLALPAILALIQAAGPALAGIIDLVHSARSTLSTDDQATLDAALSDLRAQNDATFARVDAKLAAAAAES